MYSDENYETFYSAMFLFKCYYKHLKNNMLFRIYLCWGRLYYYNSSLQIISCAVLLR